MINRLFQLVASFVLLCLLVGIIGAAMSGSDKAFDVRPVLAWLGFMKDTTTAATVKAGQDRGSNPEPITKVAAGAISRGKSQIQKQLRNKQASIVQPRSDTGKPDARLAVCKNGSIESQDARDLPLGLALKLKQEINSGKKFKSLLDVQARLGLPVCNERSRWRYLVDGGRAIDATFNKNEVSFRFTNF